MNQLSSFNKLMGKQIQSRRLANGLTQEEVAKLLGVTFQQIAKYEKGINSVPSCRLITLAAILQTDVGTLFDSLEGVPQPYAPPSRRALDIGRSLQKIKNPKHLEAIGNLARVLAA